MPTPVEIIMCTSLLLYVFIRPYIAVMAVQPRVGRACPSTHVVLPAESAARSCCHPLQWPQLAGTRRAVLGAIWGHPTASAPLRGVREAGWGARAGGKVPGLCAAVREALRAWPGGV